MTRKNALFVWEIGGGLGHVAPLLAVARSLVAISDLNPVFILKEPVLSRRVIGNGDWPVLAAPRLPGLPETKNEGASYAQLLVEAGFMNAGGLALVARAWDDLFRLLDPVLIVADHAPTAILAARGKIPILAIGTGYTMPPHGLPEFPALKNNMRAPALQNRMRDTVNSVLQSRGQPTINRLPELLKCDGRAIFSLPHLDPYGPFRQEPLIGHYETGMKPAPPRAGKGLFFYSRSDEPNLEHIVEGLAASAVHVSAYLTGSDTAATMFLRVRGATVYDEPPPLAEVLGDSAFVVSHGGAGVTSAALQVGRPQVIMPIHGESEITGLRVAGLGSALVVENVSAQSVCEAAKTVAEVRLFHEQAARIADDIVALNLPSDAPALVANAALNLI